MYSPMSKPTKQTYRLCYCYIFYQKMDRLKYSSPLLLENENTLICDWNVRLYDGEQKTNFEGGELIITTHRILWGRPGVIAKGQTCLALNLNLVVYFEEDSPGMFNLTRSRKISIYLSDPEQGNCVI